MDTRLKKLMCLLAALVMMVLPVADVGIGGGVQAEANPDGENRPVSPDASKFEYLLLHDGKTINDGNPSVYVGDQVDMSKFTCIELETDLQVSPEFIKFVLEGPVVDGVYVAAGAVTVSVVEINSGFVLCAEIFTVRPNVLAVTENVAALTYTADVIDPADFITAVTLNGQAYADYTVTCLSAEEIKNVGAYVLEVSSNNAALKAEPVQVNVEVVKATPVAAVANSSLKYTGEVLTDKDFGLTVTLGDKDVYAECTVTPSEEIKAVGEYTITVSSDNLEPVEVTVKVEPWAALNIAEVEGQPVTGTGVDVINENGYTFEITGEPEQTVIVTYNGVDTEITLDAEGNATFTPEYVEVNEGTAPAVQTVTVAYAIPGGAEGDEASFIYDDKDAEPALELTAPLNRQAEWTIVLPEYGSVTSVVATWDGETRTVFTADVTDAYSANEAHEQVLTLTELYNIPEGATYTVTFVDLAGHSRTATCEVGKSDVDIDFSTSPTGTNTHDRLQERGNLIFDVIGYANETFKVYINGDEYGTYTFDANGECEVIIDRNDLPRDTNTNVSASYVYVNGSVTSNTFIVDDYCTKPIILTPVYENAYVIAGVVEVGSTVVISYPDYPELGSTFVRPDVYGFFAAELDMLDEGDKVQIDVQDLGDNWTSVVLVAQAEDELATQMAYPMGKLFTNNRVTDQPWLVATKVKVDDLKDGVTLPILANNCFEIGEFTAVMDENGNVVYNYTVDDSVAVVVDSYMTYAKKFDYEAFAGRSCAAVEAGEAFAIDANAKEIWIYAEFAVELDVDAMVETFQLQSARDNEVKLEYTKLQRN